MHDRPSAAEVTGRNVLLVIEVSDSSLRTDLKQRTLNSTHFGGGRGSNLKSKVALETFDSKASLCVKCDNQVDLKRESHLAHDALGDKAQIYAEGGVREYWVVDCERRRLLVHRLGVDGAYGEPKIVGFDETAEAMLVPGLTVRLCELGLPD